MSAAVWTKRIINAPRVLAKMGLRGYAQHAARRIGEELAQNTNLTHVFVKPRVVHIEPTVRCNLKCVHCDVTYWDRMCPDLTYEGFRHIIDQMPDLNRVIMHGMGEPLLNKDIYRMIEYASKERNLKTIMSSNGIPIDEPNARKLIANGLQVLAISVDGATKETYEKIRVRGNFDRLIRNIKRILELKKEMNSKTPWIYFSMVCMKDNIREFLKLIELAKELGVTAVQPQYMHFWGKDETTLVKVNGINIKDEIYGKQNLFDNVPKDEMAEIRRTANEKAAELGVQLIRPFFEWEGSDHTVCHVPWVDIYVTADGYAIPCPIQGTDPRLVNFGNFFEKSYDEIWNGPLYKDFRRRLVSDDPHPVCKDCVYRVRQWRV
ncbi:MAG: radical SAM protein [Nitrospirae bacterium]|nr:radical SAM protein [Nitrospirota bacterium]